MAKNLFSKFKGGINLPHNKITQDIQTVQMPIPKVVIIPMLEHIGSPCNPIVQKGDIVKVGQKIGDSEAFVSSPVYSSVSGIVKDIKPVLYPNGFEIMSVEIETDGKQEIHESISPIGELNKQDMIEKIRESGVVGLGGAGFPTHVKLSPPAGKSLDTLIINGAECEPYITSDYREMLENTQGIIDGIKIVMRITDIKKAYIGIEENKPKAIQKLSKLLGNDSSISVISLPTRYPQGGEKQLIYSITKRVVPVGGLPSDIGVLVQNINTVSFISTYINTGMPLIKKKITVDGGAVKKPKNVEVLIGTPLKDIFEFCGGFREEPYKVIMGGPMMGVAQFSLENVILKQTNAILAFTKKEAQIPKEDVCLKCGKCVYACPMNLMPLNFHADVRIGKIENTLKYNINACIECGCCAYVCPAKLQIVQSIRYAKSQLKKAASK